MLTSFLVVIGFGAWFVKERGKYTADQVLLGMTLPVGGQLLVSAWQGIGIGKWKQTKRVYHRLMDAVKIVGIAIAIQIIQYMVGEVAGKVLIAFLACLMAIKGDKSIRFQIVPLLIIVGSIFSSNIV